MKSSHRRLARAFRVAVSARHVLAVTAFVVVVASVSHAQPAASRAHSGQLTTRFSHTFDSSVENVPGSGELAVTSSEIGVRASTPVGTTTQLMYGATLARHEVDLAGSTLLPDRLDAVGLAIGLARRESDTWRWLAMLQPRYAGAPTLGDGRFDLPVMALATYRASPELTWSFGLRYSRRSRIELLPLIGATWTPAPRWEAKLAFPETGVFYRATDALTLAGVVELHGGDFHVAHDRRPLAGGAGGPLAGAWLEYREVRTGLAAQHAFSPAVTLRADLGYAVSRRFEYQDPDLTLKAEGAPYFALSLVARF